MKVVLIKYRTKYDDCEEIVGVASNMEIANRHIEDLEKKYPYAFGREYGTYYFETYQVIEN